MLLTIISAIILSSAMLLQKQSINIKTNPINLLKNKRWLFSIVIGIFGFSLYLLDLLNENIVVIQPILSTTIIWAVLLDMLFIKKRFDKFEFMLSLLAFMGVILIGVP